MKTLKILALVLLVALLPAHRASAETVNPEPAYIVGTVSFPGFTTTSISVTAVGGGDTAQQTISGNTYQLPVSGGDWAYSVSTSCGLKDADGNSVTVSFSQRSVTVAPGAMVTNNYDFSNAGFIRFEVNITGDQPESWVSAGSWATKPMASGEKTASYSFGSGNTAERNYAWVVPIVPNQQVELTAMIDVTGASGQVQRYSFSKSALNPYQLVPRDVAPGAVVAVPLQINFVDGESPSPTYAYSGNLSGSVSLLGLPTSNLERHTFVNKSLFANPGVYTSNAINVPTGIQFTYSPGTARTYFRNLDGSPLTWPWINGDQNNNKVTIYPNTTTYLDLERAGGFLAGTINLSGSVSNEDLKAVTMLFNGVRDYNPVTKQWSNRGTYGGASTLSRDTAANAKPPTDREYQMFLPGGDWGVTTVTLTKQLQSPLRTSTVTFRDHAVQYDGKDFFGSPIHIVSGDNEQGFNYCLGSAIFRFRDPSGRLLSTPQVAGTGLHQTNGVTDMTVSTINATSTESNSVMPAVEVFGPAGNYNFHMVRVMPPGGVFTNYGPKSLNLSCNTTKILDFPGPTLNVMNPQGGILTNAQTIPVSGRAFGGSAIGSVTVNGQSATLTPVVGGSANEVAFTHDLFLENGENTITVTATEVSGAQATDQLIISVDHLQPTVSITTPVDGDRFLSTEDGIPLHIEAADRGYGYTFDVYLDGFLIHSAAGAGNVTSPETLVYYRLLTALSVGDHVISAIVSDRTGNSSTASITIFVHEPPPVLSGLDNQVIEATSLSGAVANFDVTATSTCNGDPVPVVFPAPALSPQSNSTSAGGSVSKTFSWDAVTAADGDPVQYQVQVSDALDFATIQYNSAWQSATTWAQSLPQGTWYWRVTARDSIHTTLQSSPATGNSFSILHDGSPTTVKFNILHHADCTLSGGVYPDPGNEIWVGPFDGADVDRSFLMFDTSTLGAGAAVTAAKLSLDYQVRDYVQSDSVTNVHESNWQFPGSAATYNDLGAYLASQPISVGRPLGMVHFNIRPDYVNLADITRFALAAANENYASLGNSAPGYSRSTSYLEVTYTSDTPAWAAPTLTPETNATSSGESVDKTFQWNEMTAADGDPVQFLVEISGNANFSTVDFSSQWQTSTTWTHALPTGTWYWRVTARDAVHTAVTSNPAASSFSITYQPLPAPPGEATVICSANSGDTFPLGATTVTCTARDACEGTAAGSFTITVHDTMPPALAVPADLIVEATAAAGTPVEFNVTATDTVDPSPAVICEPASGSAFTIGTTIVTCTASDASGNRAAEAFQVTVEDTNPPALTVPADMTVEATGPLTPVEIGQASATHMLPFTINSDAPESYPVATTVVTWTATDTNGKTASGVQHITVTDTTAPVVTVPANLTVEAAGPLTQVNTGDVTATDAVGVVSVTSNAPAAFPVGLTTVIWTASDAAGNVGTGVQTVFVTDQTPPALVGVENQILEATSALGAAASFNVTATDLADPTPMVACSAPSGSNFPLGDTVVTCTTTDVNGNSATSSFTIAVRDTTAPVLTVPDGITVLLNTPLNSSTIQAFLNGATAEDTVDAAVAITAATPEALTTTGEKQVIFMAVDDFGNQTARTATIRVVYGGGDEFMEPVSLHKPFKQGSTIPVKIGFNDASGAAVTSAVVRFYLYPVSNDVPGEEPIEIESTGSADTGNFFKVSGEEYHYNLSTKNLSPGTYQIRAALDDGTIRTVPLALKQ